MNLPIINVIVLSKGASSNRINVIIENEPSECPYCHLQNNPHLLSAYCSSDNTNKISAIYQCPSPKCQNFYIAIFESNGASVHGSHYSCTEIIGGEFKKQEFKDVIISISPLFVKIFNQALEAEKEGLNEICGIGFRKSIEYLLKDYVTSKNPSDKDTIAKMHLTDVVNKYITDKNLKDMSSRAIWLANDETHYKKQFEDFNLEDVKKLIQLTLYWIEVEVLTGEYKVSIQKLNKK
jgi:hypothetical protein